MMDYGGGYAAPGTDFSQDRGGSSLRLWLMGLAIVVLAAVFVAVVLRGAGHGSDEALATTVTAAVIDGKMQPVEGLFRAALRPSLEDSARVAKLSADLRALGEFKGLKEDTPPGAPPRFHRFAARFASATWSVDMQYDPDGRIGAFYIRPLDAGLH